MLGFVPVSAAPIGSTTQSYVANITAIALRWAAAPPGASIATSATSADLAWAAVAPAAETLVVGGVADLVWNPLAPGIRVSTPASSVDLQWVALTPTARVASTGAPADLAWTAADPTTIRRAAASPADLAWDAVAPTLSLALVADPGDILWATVDAVGVLCLPARIRLDVEEWTSIRLDAAPITRLDVALSDLTTILCRVEDPVDVDDVARLTVSLSVLGVLTDPATLTLVVRPPTDPRFELAYPADITRTEQGRFEARFPITETGKWRYRWIATGEAVGAELGSFTVDGGTL